ncbi:MAG: hypothetical protein ABIZ36_07270, partial [Gemmatimonadaceae bacterium]
MNIQQISRSFIHLPIAAAAMAVASIAVIPQRSVAQREGSGAWRIQWFDDGDKIQLSLEDYDRDGGRSSTGYTVAISSLRGLTASQLRGSSSDAHFQLRRDAGTFNFDGRVGNSRGAGQFGFTADPRFGAQLASRGYSRPDAHEQFQMAMHDVGFALIDELKSQGYGRTSIDDLITMGEHGVHYDYL